MWRPANLGMPSIIPIPPHTSTHTLLKAYTRAFSSRSSAIDAHLCEAHQFKLSVFARLTSFPSSRAFYNTAAGSAYFSQALGNRALITTPHTTYRPFTASPSYSKRKMPPKKKEEEKKIPLGRPGNSLKSGIVSQTSYPSGYS